MLAPRDLRKLIRDTGVAIDESEELQRRCAKLTADTKDLTRRIEERDNPPKGSAQIQQIHRAFVPANVACFSHSFGAVPVSLVGTFAVMHLFGFSLNTLSLFGFPESIR